MVEAMASGLPVVATNTGGVGEYITDGAGLLCQPQDPQALAAASPAAARRRRPAKNHVMREPEAGAQARLAACGRKDVRDLFQAAAAGSVTALDSYRPFSYYTGLSTIDDRRYIVRAFAVLIVHRPSSTDTLPCAECIAEHNYATTHPSFSATRSAAAPPSAALADALRAVRLCARAHAAVCA